MVLSPIKSYYRYKLALRTLKDATNNKDIKVLHGWCGTKVGLKRSSSIWQQCDKTLVSLDTLLHKLILSKNHDNKHSGQGTFDGKGGVQGGMRGLFIDMI